MKKYFQKIIFNCIWWYTSPAYGLDYYIIKLKGKFYWWFEGTACMEQFDTLELAEEDLYKQVGQMLKEEEQDLGEFEEVFDAEKTFDCDDDTFTEIDLKNMDYDIVYN